MVEVLYFVVAAAIVYGFYQASRRAEVQRKLDFALTQLAEERAKAHTLEMRTRQARDSRGRFLGLIEGERR